MRFFVTLFVAPTFIAFIAFNFLIETHKYIGNKLYKLFIEMAHNVTRVNVSEIPKREGDYRHDPILMRFVENCSLLLKLVCQNIGFIIREDYNAEYCEGLNHEWMKLTQKFTETVDYADSYDSEASSGSDTEFDDTLKFVKLIRKSLTCQPPPKRAKKDSDCKTGPAKKFVHLEVMKRVVLLLECVLVNPALYDRRHQFYNDDEYHIKIWNEIHQSFSNQWTPAKNVADFTPYKTEFEIKYHQKMAQRMLNRLKWPLVAHIPGYVPIRRVMESDI